MGDGCVAVGGGGGGGGVAKDAEGEATLLNHWLF